MPAEGHIIQSSVQLPQKEMATHSRILAWEISQTEEPGGHGPWGCKESDAEAT